ncbi:helix-turn-helix domain-containing protein [Listeria seeligeri]|uniref:helix-turn-helix domain-containing protein n=1 Tax=Listeria seeligeri TaxID=1640 RepID=UPI0016262888|nr:XRE family transcriptional regulator [Listeria seeligeri]MBC1851150.1 helix-turn-helix transcriptional regulator [Listeria seeligeri]MBC1929366.1 helix-turn-helix transcriptional regulator [Listeria seeligeri]MBC6130506.1 helix-turn-helix transcriptional regulator [Listeria seeligeri]MBF2370246.1 XRE family transcriptional regulator [Listeria seeligeri]MBF2390443.1 XRE family transcriptional regulator [Listeria seeligeri]
MIKNRFAILLAERGLKISDVYNITGISRSTLTKLSNNDSSGVQFDTLNRICTVLDIGPSDFFDYYPGVLSTTISRTDLYLDNSTEEDIVTRIEVDIQTKFKRKILSENFYGSIYGTYRDYQENNHSPEFVLYFDLSPLETESTALMPIINLYDEIPVSFRRTFLMEIYGKVIEVLTSQLKLTKTCTFTFTSDSDHIVIEL